MIEQEPRTSVEVPPSLLTDRQLLEAIHLRLVELAPLLEAVKRNRAVRSFLGIK